MQLSPRYDGAPVLHVEVEGPAVATALVRQRDRFAAALGHLDAAAWAAPSRCDGWSVHDVVTHLTGTNQFWAISLAKGIAGAPTRYLVGFDPVATPAQLVEAQRAPSPEAALGAFRTSCDELAEIVTGIEGDGWATPAEAPPGHLSATCVALHALWDSWVHERDVLLPLGQPAVEEPGEVACALRYAAGLGPGFRATAGQPGDGAVALVTTAPELHLVVEVGDQVVVRDGDAPVGAPVLHGDAVGLVEALSQRGPFPDGTPDAARHLLAGLAEVFDQA